MTATRLTIRSVEARPVVVPLNRPVIAKIGTFPEWPLVLIDVTTEEGVVGRSYLEPYIAKSMRYIIPAIHDVIEAIKDQPIAPHDAYLSSRKWLNLVGLQGVTMIAIAGVDMALWDARARAAGLPLAEFLGGSVGPVPAYNSNGLWLSPLDGLGTEAAELAAQGGFTALKLRLGRDRIADDIAAIAAVRAATSDNVKLMCDFNQGQTLGDALDRCHGLDDQGLTWFEEPIPYDNLTGYAELKRSLKTPIQLGENFYGPRSLMEALEADAGTYVMPDLMRIGGVSGWMRAAAIAGTAGIQMSSHLYPEFSAHLLRVTDTAHWLEWQDWADMILTEPYVVKDGRLEIPNKPGVGLDWNEDAVARHRIDG